MTPMTPTDIIAAAAVKADRINDLMGVRNEAIRRHNRLSWAAQDMESAGVEGWEDLTREAFLLVGFVRGKFR